MPLQPFTGTFGPAELRHLLRRTLFGTTQEDLTAFQGKSLNAVLDELLNVNINIDSPPVLWVEGYNLYRRYLFNDPNQANTIVYNPPANSNYPIWPAKSELGMEWLNQDNWRYVSGSFQGGSTNSWYTYYSSGFNAWWCGNLLHQDRTIKEKMILFLHNFLPIKNIEVAKSDFHAYEYYKLLVKYCTGNYKDFVYEMTFNPSMLTYLDGVSNIAFAPNENYARELQELFTVGKPMAGNNDNSSYNADDVAGIAKLLTGWVHNPSWKREESNIPLSDKTDPVKFDITKYDRSAVRLSAYYAQGISQQRPRATTINGPLIPAVVTVDANVAKQRFKVALDIIFTRKDVAKHIVRKLYRYFVYSFINEDNSCPPNIEQTVIEPLADILFANNYELKPVIKALLTSDHFFGTNQRGCMIKNPMDFVVGTLRTFKIDQKVPQLKTSGPQPQYICSKYDGERFKSIARYTFWENKINSYCKEMGYKLLDPPNVAGLPAYHQASSYHHQWISAQYVNVRQRFLGLKNDYTGIVGKDAFSLTYNPIVTDFVEVSKSIIPSIPPRTIDPLKQRNKFIDQLLEHFLAVRPSQDYLDNKIRKLNIWSNSTEWDTFKDRYNGVSPMGTLNDDLKKFYTVILELEEFQLM